MEDVAPFDSEAAPMGRRQECSVRELPGEFLGKISDVLRRVTALLVGWVCSEVRAKAGGSSVVWRRRRATIAQQCLIVVVVGAATSVRVPLREEVPPPVVLTVVVVAKRRVFYQRRIRIMW